MDIHLPVSQALPAPRGCARKCPTSVIMLTVYKDIK
jgi:hypothetical protein